MKNKNSEWNSKTSSRNIEQLRRLILVYAVVYISILVISLFKQSYLNFSPLESASFKGADQPWLPAGLIPQPIFGNHYFGDFYLPFRFVNEANPYFPENPFNNILPFGHISYQVLGLFSVNDAFYIYSLISVLIFIKGLQKILLSSGNIESRDAILLGLLMVSFSFPIVTALDRGANVLFVAALISWAIGLILSEKSTSAKNCQIILIFSYSISAKIYLLPLLLIIWLFYSKKIATHILLVTIFLNFLLSFQFGGPKIVYQQLMEAFTASSATTNPDYLFGSLSFSGLISQFLQKINCFPNDKLLVSAIILIPGILFVALVVLICRIQRFSLSLTLVPALSFFQYVSPVSYVYTGVWATISLTLIASIYLKGIQKENSCFLKLLTIGIVTQLLPLHLISEFRFLIPLCWFITMLFFVGKALQKLFILKSGIK